MSITSSASREFVEHLERMRILVLNAEMEANIRRYYMAASKSNLEYLIRADKFDKSFIKV